MAGLPLHDYQFGIHLFVDFFVLFIIGGKHYERLDIVQRTRKGALIQKENGLKVLYCRTVTSMTLKLIRRFDGDIIGDRAFICNFSREEPSKDKNGHTVDGAFRIFFPNNQAICYALSGEISFVL